MPALSVAERTSIEHLCRSEVYVKKPLSKVTSRGVIEPSSSDALRLPFALLPGEYAQCHSRVLDDTLIVLTNFRIFVSFFKRDHNAFYNIPILCVDGVECREMFYLHIACKDGRIAKVCFENNESCLAWFKLLTSATSPPCNLEDVFAFAYFAWCKDEAAAASPSPLYNVTAADSASDALDDPDSDCEKTVVDEFRRLRFESSLWRITSLNRDYSFCPTFPRYWIVPATVSDAEIQSAGRYRSLHRVPAVVWRHVENCTVLARSSQPESGIFGWRSAADEALLQEITIAVRKQALNATNRKPMLILDARSYTAAWANRAKGGGFESAENYTDCEVEFLGLPNIHSIRYSFQKLRSMCWEATEESWFQNLESCQWINHLYALLNASHRVVEALHIERRSVLVHCSDGWDRTTQIICLAKLMLDPYYRTLKGFRCLIEREWVGFGHKFAERSGMQFGDVNQRSPVFLQWLDCVHHLIKRYPCSFQFNETYLAKLAQHAYSGLFGTFVCNSMCERLKQNVLSRTFSVWSYLNSNSMQFMNVLYSPDRSVLVPNFRLRDVAEVWRAMYCPVNDPSHPRGVVGREAPTAPDDRHAERSLVRSHSCDSIASSGGVLNDHCSSSGGGAQFPLPLPAASHHRIGSDSNMRPLWKCGEGADGTGSGEVGASQGIDLVTVDAATDGEVTIDDDAIETMRNMLDTVDLWPGAITNDVANSSDLLLNGYGARYRSISGAEDCQDAATASEEDSDPNLVTGAQLTLSSRLDSGILNGIGNTNCDTSTSTTDISDSNVTRYTATTTENCHVYNGGDTHDNGNDDEDDGDLYRSRYDVFLSTVSFAKSPRERSSASTTPPTAHFMRRTKSTSYSEDEKLLTPANRLIDVDGLIKADDPVQRKVREIVVGYHARIQALQRKIANLKSSLVCRQCRKSLTENCSDVVVPNATGDKQNNDDLVPGSYDSRNSVSDTSWEAIDEPSTMPTRWIPDHAAVRCMGCDCEFWVINRKHHCRACGKIFCSNCSSFECPVPDEQFYEPVRVCNSCFTELQSQRQTLVK